MKCKMNYDLSIFYDCKKLSEMKIIMTGQPHAHKSIIPFRCLIDERKTIMETQLHAHENNCSFSLFVDSSMEFFSLFAE